MTAKNYSLLRPFDIEAAKAGEPFRLSHIDYECIFIGKFSDGLIAFESNGQKGINSTSAFRMKPLAWVEGKPVYKGDTLWHNTGAFVTALQRRLDGREGFVCTDRDWVHVDSLTWQPPKVKKEGCISIEITSPRNSNFDDVCIHVCETAVQAKHYFGIDKATVIKIKWEE